MIFVKDMDRMTTFYRDAVGLRVRSGVPSDGWVEFDAGSSSLALHAIPPAIADRITITDPPQQRSNTPLKLIFETPDLNAARAHLASHGAVMHEPRNTGSCDGLDPEGNVFCIVTPREK